MLHPALAFPSWPSQQQTRGSAIPLMPMPMRELDFDSAWLWLCRCCGVVAVGCGFDAWRRSRVSTHSGGPSPGPIEVQAHTHTNSAILHYAMHAASPHTTWLWFGTEAGRRLARIGADDMLLAGQQVFTQRTDKAPCNLCSRHRVKFLGDSRETQSETPTSK